MSVARADPDLDVDDKIPQTPVKAKKMLNLVKRNPTFFMGSNNFLINKVMSYMKIKDILSLMSVDYITRATLKNNNQFWFNHYKIVKFGKAQNRYNYRHNDGPIRYGCLDCRYTNRAPPHDFWMNYRIRNSGITRQMYETMSNDAITNEHLLSINMSRYGKYIEAGATKASLVHTRFIYGLSATCAREHWTRTVYHSDRYRNLEFDNTANYYNQCLLGMVNEKKLSKKIKEATFMLKSYERSVNFRKKCLEEVTKKFNTMNSKLELFKNVDDYYTKVVLKELGTKKVRKAPIKKKPVALQRTSRKSSRKVSGPKRLEPGQFKGG